MRYLDNRHQVERLKRELIILHYIFKPVKGIDDEISSLGIQDKFQDKLNPAEGIIVEDLVLDCALRLRLLDDRFKSIYKKAPVIYNNVGTVESSSKVVDLDQREASNKILHAEQMGANVKLFIGIGSKNNIKWRVEIDMEKYCMNGLLICQEIEKNIP